MLNQKDYRYEKRDVKCYADETEAVLLNWCVLCLCGVT